MNNWTVKHQIIVGFSAVILIMVILSAFASLLLFEIKNKAISITTDTWPGLYVSSQIEALSSDSLASIYKYVTADEAGKPAVKAEIGADRSKLDELMKQYEQTSFREDDRRIFTAMTESRTACEAAYNPLLESDQKRTPSEIQDELHRRVEPACKQFLKWVDAEVENNKQAGDESNARVLSSVKMAEIAVSLGLLVGLILALVSVYILVQAVNRPLRELVSVVEVMRTGNLSERAKIQRQDEFGVLAEGLNRMATDLTGLIGRVQESGLQVSSSSAEIAATSQQQLSTANEIAATTAEIGATSKQISVTSKELVQTMRSVAEVAEKTTVLANSGQAGLARMKGTVQQIVEASVSIHERLEVLSEKASNIGIVITTIIKVADQTNLLSLNAAIEAEKAGDYGRGFSVVAAEIRRLADQTASATSEIENTVKEMQSAVTAGVMGMEKFSEQVRKGVEAVEQVSEELLQIIQQVQTLTPNFEIVNEGMQSQSLGAQQISESLTQLSEAAKQTVESLRQSNRAVEQLNETAGGLQSGVSRFTLVA